MAQPLRAGLAGATTASGGVVGNLSSAPVLDAVRVALNATGLARRTVWWEAASTWVIHAAVPCYVEAWLPSNASAAPAGTVEFVAPVRGRGGHAPVAIQQR